LPVPQVRPAQVSAQLNPSLLHRVLAQSLIVELVHAPLLSQAVAVVSLPAAHFAAVHDVEPPGNWHAAPVTPSH
jgi:hypothetical protein